MEKAKELWQELSDIPLNNNEEIDISWNGFERGTPILDIWTWFEETFNLSVAKDLMGL